MNVDDGIRDAVDLLVREYGRDGAEQELQSRYSTDQQDRAKVGLAVLRRGDV